MEQVMGHPQVRIASFQEKKRRGEKIAMLTAYDAVTARLLDEAGVDALLVGDSVGMAVLGFETTLPVTLDAMVHHTAAVRRGASRALIVADMPFLTYQISPEEALRNAGRLVQEGGAAAVKLEGGRPVAGIVRRLVEVGIPVMGHLGVLPQSVHQLSGYRQRAATPIEADALLEDATALECAGAFAIVLESIPPDVAALVTSRIAVPTIGIGAGPSCDGQILVSHDMLGLTTGVPPPFVKTYAKLGESIAAAAGVYVEDVRTGRFPEVRVPAADVRS
jgi:3-methyl-2-oxobutanoate hydroxymethyltransferase